MRSGWWIALGLAACGDGGPVEQPPLDLDEDRDGFPASQDCDDLDDDVYPGAADPWYDGEDTDCAGNDDFDFDGDGAPSDAYGGGDCDDFDPAVGPDVPEAPYDGVDQDCDPATLDDDLDGDGHPLAEDCADTDPLRFVGAPERLDDGIDQDCDGHADASAWGWSDLTFLDPGTPHLAETKDFVVLALTAGDAESPTWFPGETLDGVGLLLSLDPLGTNGAALAAEPTVWYQSDVDPPGASDLAVVDNVVHLATTYYESDNRFGYLFVQPFEWAGAGIGWFPNPPSYAFHTLTTWREVDLAEDALGALWMCASDEDTIAYMEVAGPSSPSGSLAGIDGSGGCAVTAAPDFTVCDASGDCTDYEGLTAAADQPWTAPVRTLRTRDGVIAATLQGGGVIRGLGAQRTVLLPDLDLTDAEIALDEAGDTWIAAVADRGDGPEVLLATIDGATVTERWTDVEDGNRTLEPRSVALHVTEQRVVLAVSAYDTDGTGRDRLGWMLLTR